MARATDLVPRGEALVAEAEALLSSRSRVWALFTGRSNKLEASRLLMQAAQSFKLASNWRGAANALQRALALQDAMLGTGSVGRPAVCVEFATLQDKAGLRLDAIRTLQEQALPQLLASGQHIQAAEVFAQVAALRAEEGDADQALHMYREAAQLFRGSKRSGLCAKCMRDAGALFVKLGSFDTAATAFEEGAASSLDAELTCFNAPGLFVNAALCVLALDDVARAAAVLERASQQAGHVGGATLLLAARSIVDDVAAGNVAALAHAPARLTSYSSLTQVRAVLLERIQANVARRSGSDSDSGGAGGAGAGAGVEAGTATL